LLPSKRHSSQSSPRRPLWTWHHRGFKLQIEDRTGRGYEALDEAAKAFLAKAAQAPELARVFSGFQVNVPQLYADIDRTKARQLGVAVTDVFETLQIYLGSIYVNDFNKFGRVYSVRVQADAPFRARADDVGQLKVRSRTGEMVPLATLLHVRQSAGPERAMRYNGFLAADINGAPAPGYSTGQAQAAVERIAAETLPQGFSYEWTELTYQEILAGNSGSWCTRLQSCWCSWCSPHSTRAWCCRCRSS